jgi:hypothetical protein
LKSLEYGYGFLSVFIISILSLAGFLAFPLMKKPYYKYLNAFFTALAVGTLFADSAFELFPVVCIRLFQYFSFEFFKSMKEL